MEPWVLADGTKVFLGGKVEGDSSCAQRLRALIRGRARHPVDSEFGPLPRFVALDVDVPYLLDAFVRHWGGAVESAPEFEAPEVKPTPISGQGAY